MNQPANPQSGNTVLQTNGPSPYVTAAPPGVAIQLPGSQAQPSRTSGQKQPS